MIIFSKIQHDWNNLKEKIGDAFAEIFSLLPARLYMGAALFLNINLWIFSWLFYRLVRGELIVLHYNVDFGVDFFGDSRNIFIIPALGFFFLLFNFLLLSIFSETKILILSAI
jgi:hypothetical protein